MIVDTLKQAIALVSLQATGYESMWAIVGTSLAVALSSSLIATLLGLPLGMLVAIKPFKGRGLVVAFINTALGLPSVIVGLIAYLMLSRAGPLGYLGWLYTPAAMIFAQTLLITPMVAALCLPVVERPWNGYRDLFKSLNASPWQSAKQLAIDCRYALLGVYLTALGRALAEVGAVMTVGGNIANQTRVMTTAIALETSKGDLALALALGVVLVGLVFAVMLAAQLITQTVAKRYE